MPQVLWLCEYPELHGAEQSLLANLDVLREGGWQVVACAPTEGPLAEELARERVTIIALPLVEGAGELARDRRRGALAEIVRQVRPDLVHANSLAMGRLSGPVVERLRVPSLAHLRDIVGLSRAAIDDLNRHTRLLAVSKATARFHAAQGVDRSKLYTLYNGVSLSRFAPTAPSGFLHRRFDLPADAPLLGAIGQIGLRKGFDVLLDALTHVLQEVPEAHLLIVGARTSDKDESRVFELTLRERASRPPLAGHVHWLGVSRDIPAVLAELALLTHPARQEPLGRVLLEAAAAGCAIVATDVGGTREIFPPRRRPARLVPPDDADAMAAAIVELLGDAAARHALEQSARSRATERFDVQRSARALRRHYHAVTRAAEP